MKHTGLREAHAHIAQHGREMSQLSLADCRSRAECLDRIAAEAARLGSEPGWLIANGVRVESWTGSPGGPVWPTMRELDRACPARPCMVQSFDHHACIVNAAAFAASGFRADSPDPENGRIVRDPRGEITGLLLESAYGVARRAAPTPTPEQLRRIIKLAVDDLASHGFVEVHDLLSPPSLGPVLAELDDSGQLPVSVWLYPTLEDVETVAAGSSAWQRPRIRLAGAKLFADGTLNSRTAWMLAPYKDPLPSLPRGQQMLSIPQLMDAMRLTDQLGIGLAVHAIGDAAVRAVLDAYEQHQPNRDRKGADSSVPHGRGLVPALRIEHAELIDEADIPRFAQLGVVCSVQPCHLLYDIEALTRGQPSRLHRVLPLRDLIQAGCRPGELLWFGSDTPIVRPDPADSIQAATQRGRADDPVRIAPEQAISEAQAWSAFTVRG